MVLRIFESVDSSYGSSNGSGSSSSSNRRTDTDVGSGAIPVPALGTPQPANSATAFIEPLYINTTAHCSSEMTFVMYTRRPQYTNLYANLFENIQANRKHWPKLHNYIRRKTFGCYGGGRVQGCLDPLCTSSRHSQESHRRASVWLMGQEHGQFQAGLKTGFERIPAQP